MTEWYTKNDMKHTIILEQEGKTMAEPVDYTPSLDTINENLKTVTDFIEHQKSEEYIKAQELERTQLDEQLKVINDSLIAINKTLTPSKEEAALPDEHLNTLLLAVKDTNSYLSNIQNFNLSMMIGIGLVIGIVATTIFSRYLRH